MTNEIAKTASFRARRAVGDAGLDGWGGDRADSDSNSAASAGTSATCVSR